MGQDKKEGYLILRRVLKYSDRIYDLSRLIAAVRDERKKPQIKTTTVVTSALAMALSQRGSLNALEQTSEAPFWQSWIGGALPSADTIGNVFSTIICDDLRKAIRHVYARLKRNKALKPILPNGLFALIIDGHESSNSYDRCCAGCLTRVMHTSAGDRIQYYHRNVTAVLLCQDFPLLLDVEAQVAGEDEVAAALRLLERIFENYPRAFELILADGLYTRAPFIKVARKYGKEVITVLKDERRDLLQDAMGIFDNTEPIINQDSQTQRQCWDVEHFTSWTQLDEEIRVVRSLETTITHRQIDNREKVKNSDWLWAVTASQSQLSTEAVITFGHKRWTIENECFNELVNFWKVNHVYKHSANAITAFWLIIMLAYNLFHAFICYNLKPQVREDHSKQHWVQVIAAVLYADDCRSP